MEPATFRFVAQHINTVLPRSPVIYITKRKINITLRAAEDIAF